MQRDISDHSFYAWRRSLSGGYAVQFAELKTIDIPASADALELILYFKALKQNLTVKTFVGSSENALRIQIWTALMVLLLLKWLHHLSQANWSLSNLASMLRLNLFTYRDLTKWLHDPMETPSLVPAAEQLTLTLV